MAIPGQQPIDATYFYERSLAYMHVGTDETGELLPRVKVFIKRETGSLVDSDRAKELLYQARELKLEKVAAYIDTAIDAAQAAKAVLPQTQVALIKQEPRQRALYPGEPAVFQLERRCDGIEGQGSTRFDFSSDTRNAFINQITLTFHKDGRQALSIRSECVDQMKAFLAAEGFPVQGPSYQFTQSTYEKHPSLEEMEPILRCWRTGDTQGMLAALAARPELGIRMNQYPFIYPRVAYCSYYVTNTEDARRLLDIVTRNNIFPQNSPMSSRASSAAAALPAPELS